MTGNLRNYNDGVKIICCITLSFVFERKHSLKVLIPGFKYVQLSLRSTQISTPDRHVLGRAEGGLSYLHAANAWVPLTNNNPQLIQQSLRQRPTVT